MTSLPDRNAATLLDIFSTGRRLTYQPKDLIYRVGDVPSGVYLITSGMVKVYTLNSRADESIILTLHDGETFFVNWAFGGSIGPIYVMAMTPTEVIRISREHLLELCKANTAVALRMLHELANHFSLLADHINNLDYRSAHERLACQLLRIAMRHGKRLTTNAFIIQRATASHSHIAATTSMARETVTRELNSLETQGIIRRSQKSIIIPDIKKLANIIQVDWPPTGN
jgi:CRP/FNR family transcriptional regulator, cyclic AMP receptor protein